MKIRRIRVLLAKGWCKVVCFVSFSIFSFVCNHVSAQKVIDMSSYKEPDSLLTVDEVSVGHFGGTVNLQPGCIGAGVLLQRKSIKSTLYDTRTSPSSRE